MLIRLAILGLCVSLVGAFASAKAVTVDCTGVGHQITSDDFKIDDVVRLVEC